MRIFLLGTILIILASCAATIPINTIDPVESITDTEEFTEKAMIKVRAKPTLLGMTPNGEYLYVSSIDSETKDCFLSLINIESREIENSVNIHTTISVIVTDKKYAYIGGQGRTQNQSSILFKFDIESRSIVSEIEMEKGFYPIDAVVSPEGDRLYVSDANGLFISVIDTNEFRIIQKISLNEGQSFGLDILRDGSRLYVVHAYKRSISIIDTRENKVIKVINDVSQLPVNITVSENGKIAYIADSSEPYVTVLNLDENSEKVLGKIDIGAPFSAKMGLPYSFSSFSRLYLTKDSKHLLLWMVYLNFIPFIELDKQKTTSAVLLKDGVFCDMAIDPTEQFLFLTEVSDDSVIILSRGPQKVK